MPSFFYLNENKKFFVNVNGESEGAFELSELMKMKIKPTTLIWMQGLKNWTEAKEIPELKQLFDKH